MTQTIINKEVAITAVGFGKNLRAYPRRMEFDGKTYYFIDQGLACIVSKGQRVAQVLTLSDGLRQFRLRSDNRGGSWTLLTVGV